jgi:hypothetical protein
MQRSLLSLLLICAAQATFAQSSVQLSGQVKDNDTKEPIPFCKVVVLDPNDSIVRGGFSDDKGFFNLPVEPGMYRMVASTYGYANDTLQTGFAQQDAFVGVFKMKADVLNLEDVKVEASSRLDLLERDVQIVTDEQKLGSTAAKDVLNKMPGISYDEYSGKLKVDSDPNILVLVNGVEKDQEYVQNLEPERLLRVETIRDPGGRYGLEGYSAIVNIILKDDYKGTEFYLENMNLIDFHDQSSRLEPLIFSLGGTFNYTYNNLNIYASGRYDHHLFRLPSFTETHYKDGYRVLETGPTDRNVKIIEDYTNYTLGFDYKFNPKHQLSFESHLQTLPGSRDENDFEFDTQVIQGDSLLSSFSFSENTITQSSDYYNSLFYIGELNEKNKLNINFTHSYYTDDYTRHTLQENVYDRLESGINKKQYTRFYAEYDHKFSAKTTLQIGYGNYWRSFDNRYQVNQQDLATNETFTQDADFTLSDIRHKLYTNLSWKMSKKWGMMVGIAAESSSPRALGQQFHYFIYQPLFDLKFNAGKNFNARLKYRVSGEYPGITESNPFVSQVNPRMISSGNPFLKPTTNHILSLRMNLFGGMISLEPYAHFSNNYIAQIGVLDSNNIMHTGYENVRHYEKQGVELNFSKFFPFSVLLQGNVNFYRAKLESSTNSNEVMDWRADADLIYIFKKTESLLGLKYQRNQCKYISGLGYDKGDVDFWLLFYKQPLFKKRGSIMLGYFLPLDFGVNYNQGWRMEIDGFTMQSYNDVSLIKNMFILEFSFRFTKGNSVRQMEKDLKKEEEKKGGGVF